MKLLARINKYYLIFLLFFSPVMILADYYIIDHIVDREVNEILKHECERIQFHLDKEGRFPSSNYLVEGLPVSEGASASNRFTDTLIYEPHVEKLVPYRTYECVVEVDNEQVRIVLRHVLLEMHELTVWLLAMTALMLLLLIMGLYFINQRISTWVWKPFFENLGKLRHYDINKKNPVRLESSGISEFEAFNKVVTALMDQVKKDFQNLKEFNENISHEMQTPLAIIRNKMVLLLESQNLNEKELQWVQAAYQEVNKLSKIGKSLILISRIENQEFTRLDSVDLRAVINNIISNMEEVIAFKNLDMKISLKSVKVKGDLVLANILFTNLIKNAVQHNREGGYIKLWLDEEKFEIENSGEILQTDTALLFNRFQKGAAGTESLGLGLAISQKVCDIYGFRLNYEHAEGRHKFSLFFHPGGSSVSA